jgi:hypothetical protein
MTLADGTAASGWSVASASGLDYGQPVPEPGTGLLLLAGLGLAGLAVKHRQAARAR